MRILFVVGNFPPILCGVGDYTYCLTREATRAGHRAIVLTGEHAAVEDKRFAPDGLRVLPLLPSGGIARLRAVVRAVRAEGADVVSFQYVPHLYGRGGLAPGISLLPLRLRRATGVPVITTLHETYFPWAGSLVHRLLGTAHRAQLVALVAGSSRIVVNTWARREKLQRLFPRKAAAIAYVPSGSAIDRVPLGSEQAAAVRARWGLDGTAVLATFGTLHPDKDLLTLVRALAKLSLALSVRVLCIGDIGKRDEALPRQAAILEEARRLGLAEALIWTGPLPPAEVSRCLAVAELFVFPVRGGPSGRRSSLIPALSHGLPLVAYAGPETDPVFVDGHTAMLVRPGDPQDLAKAIERVMGDAVLRCSLGEAVQQLYEAEFTWRRILDGTLGFDERAPAV